MEAELLRGHMAKKWYVIQTYSGYENKVKEALLQRIKEHSKEPSFGEILIPTETVQEARAGGKNCTHQEGSIAHGRPLSLPSRDYSTDRPVKSLNHLTL